MKKNSVKQKKYRKKQRAVNHMFLKSMKNDSYNKDRTLKTANEYAECVLKDVSDNAIYSTEIKW
jgi:hypothetical protein